MTTKSKCKHCRSWAPPRLLMGIIFGLFGASFLDDLFFDPSHIELATQWWRLVFYVVAMFVLLILFAWWLSAYEKKVRNGSCNL